MKSKIKKNLSKKAYINEYVSLHLKAKPKWLPNKVWNYCINKLLYIEKFKHYK